MTESNPGTPDPSIDSRLEHNLKLSDLVNPESLRNLCHQFSVFRKVPIMVTNHDGSVLYGEDLVTQTCNEGLEEGQSSNCPACSPGGPVFDEGSDKISKLACDTGLQFLRARVENQFDLVGHVRLGPFCAATEQLTTTLPDAPAFSFAEGEEVLLLLCTVLEELVFANYQSYVFSKMHLQVYSDNLGELVGKDEELQKYEDTLVESKDLRSLF